METLESEFDSVYVPCGPNEAVFDRSQLLAEFTPLVKRLVIQYGSSPQLREDLTGEIYHRFCTLLDLYDPSRGIPLRPYLVRQLTASVYTFVRSHRRYASRETLMDTVDIAGSEMVTDPTDDWDTRLMLEETGKAIDQALQQISDRQRQVIVWRYFHDYTFEQIAEELNIEVSTARSLLRHGLTRMKIFLSQSADVDL